MGAKRLKRILTDMCLKINIFPDTTALTSTEIKTVDSGN